MIHQYNTGDFIQFFPIEHFDHILNHKIGKIVNRNLSSIEVKYSGRFGRTEIWHTDIDCIKKYTKPIRFNDRYFQILLEYYNILGYINYE